MILDYDLFLHEEFNFFKKKTSDELRMELDNTIDEIRERIKFLNRVGTEKAFYKFNKSILKYIKLFKKFKKVENDTSVVEEYLLKIRNICIRIRKIMGFPSFDWLNTIDKLNELLYEFDMGRITYKGLGNKHNNIDISSIDISSAEATGIFFD